MTDILHTLLYMLNEMSPYILLGFFIAGLLHAMVPERIMSRHLAGTGFGSVFKAALVGIPLPLCSCGVLPTAVALRRAGASRASSTAFLISTPQTGVDSIAATYSLLGPAMAVIRPIAAFVTALVGGTLTGVAERKDDATEAAQMHQQGCCEMRRSMLGRVRETLKYGFFDLVQSIGTWLVTGLIIAALITVFVPNDLFVSLSKYPLLAMFAVVVVAVPMYVCATGSIPIAMSLMLKGLSPGTALVLLMAGPAANFASITIISRAMGRRAAAIYLGTIIGGAIAFGLMIDYLLPREWFALPSAGMMEHAHHHFSTFSTVCSSVLVVLLIVALIRRYASNTSHTHNHNIDMTNEYKIKGMSCAHCKASVEKGLSALEGVTSVSVNLSQGTATVEGDVDAALVRKTIEDLGFENG